MSDKNYTVDYWRDLFARLGPDLPFERIAAWMTVESNGFPQALGTRYEVGIVQIDLQDGPRWGGSTDTLHTNFCASATSQVRVRDLTDSEEELQVTSAVAYITSLVNTSRGQVADGWSDDDLWCLVKLHHALPALASQGLANAQAAGQADSWDMMRAYLESLPCDTFPGWGCTYSPWSRFFNNAEKVGKLGLSGLLGFANTDMMLTLAVLFAIGLVLWRFA